MEQIECPYCDSDFVAWSHASQLYHCRDCGEWFEDDVPVKEQVKPLQRTKLNREE